MRMSRERIFYLADRILAEIQATEGVAALKLGDDLKGEVMRVLTDETKFEESIDQEIRRILATYSRAPVPGSSEWEVMYQKTREEVYRKRFRR
ncbi:MAG: DUF507 family protein [candidate division NC10 bacterium]